MSSRKTMKVAPSDPRTANPTPVYVPESEAARRAVKGYKMGHEDATNQTVRLAKTPEGAKALIELVVGEAAAYRSAMRRERRRIAD